MRKNLIGQKFEKLTVISEAQNILPKNGKGRSFTSWNCQCECGQLIIVRTGTLIAGQQKSCGCDRIKDLTGKIFNRLTVISICENIHNRTAWLCQCECGNLVKLTSNALLKNNTKSCGCLKIEKSSKNIEKAIAFNTKFEPSIASARRVWKSYFYNGDINCTLSFKKFYELSQMNCYYCGIAPSNEYNYFLKKKDASLKGKQEGLFIYNGMDRIDNHLSHTDENCVACCYICNRAKNNRNLNDFKNYINKLTIQHINYKFNKIELILNNYILTSMRTVYRIYNDGNISLEEFYSLSQLPCFYCGIEKSNITNYAKTDYKSSQKAIEEANFIYNGLDRIDSSKLHNLDNVVPCCKYCNFAKGKLSLEKFYTWIKRIKEYQKNKKET